MILLITGEVLVYSSSLGEAQGGGGGGAITQGRSQLFAKGVALGRAKQGWLTFCGAPRPGEARPAYISRRAQCAASK